MVRSSYTDHRGLDTFSRLDEITDDYRDLIRLMHQDEYNREHGLPAPDTIGADYFFIEGFITRQMYLDFSYIESYFLEHCYEHLPEYYEADWCKELIPGFDAPRQMIQQKVLIMMYNGAKLGDEYCRALLKNVYQIYHKKEYNQLKRFRRISPEEILSISRDEEGYMDYSIMGRVLGMCPIMNIDLDESCSLLFLLLNERRKEWIEEDKELIEHEWFSDELFKECGQQVHDWIAGIPSQHWVMECKAYWEMHELVGKLIKHFGAPEDMIERVVENYRGLELELTRTLATLRFCYPKREFTFEETQRYCVIYTMASALTSMNEEFDCEIDYLLGAKDEPDEYFVPLFKPESVKVAAKVNKPEVPKQILHTAAVPLKNESIDEYRKEIEELRKQLKSQEQENRHLRSLLHDAKAAQRESEQLLTKYELDHEELIALREFAYRMQQDEIPIVETSIEEMKSVIADKKIVIIGGHVNWINKLKQHFPEWTYLHLSAFKTMDGKNLIGKDRVYFFTDHLSHMAYGKFIAAVRENHIPFGYLAGINIDQVIRRIYEDFSE